MAGTNNFTQHNPTEANQISDTDFAANSLTTGGIGEDAIMPSDWMNARWYEDSTFVFAFTQMMAAKGYNMSKDNAATLAGVLANVLTNADQKPNMRFVNFSPTPVWDCSAANGFSMQLTGSIAPTLENVSTYQVITLSLQNLNNGLVVTYPSNMHGGLQPLSTTYVGLNFQQFIILTDGNAYALDTLIQALLATKQSLLGYTPVQQGTGIGQLSNVVKVGWSGTRLKATVDATDAGNFVFDTQLAAAIAGVVSISSVLAVLSPNGSLRIPVTAGGVTRTFILQWCQGNPLDGTQNGVVFATNFPSAFPNACLWANASTFIVSGLDLAVMPVFSVTGWTAAAVSYFYQRNADHSTTTVAPLIFAVGW